MLALLVDSKHSQAPLALNHSSLLLKNLPNKIFGKMMGRWGKDDIPLRTHAGKWTTTFKASQVKYSISQEEFESYV